MVTKVNKQLDNDNAQVVSIERFERMKISFTQAQFEKFADALADKVAQGTVPLQIEHIDSEQPKDAVN